MVQLDVPHVFRVFGGPRGLMDVFDLKLAGHGLSYNTIQMWHQRNRIPTKWVGALIYCIEHEGHRCLEFLVDHDEMKAPPHNNKTPSLPGPRFKGSR